ncbi:MAG: efflux RND transporter periplasmic adaptor subunit [Tannerella sp.]|jgi:RND family efflux transporter MFP subunit|nr:efflux RND transporter periplasmic adaptor subunit [Tannerella sp.]
MNKNSVFLAISMALLMAGCTGGGQQTTTATDNAQEVKVQAVHSQTVDQEEVYTATIEPYTRNMISTFQATMRIEKIMVEVGDYVTAGQLLVQMEQASYLQAKLQLENLKVDYNRTESLFQTGGVSKQTVDQLKTQLDVTQETFDNLEKNTFLKSPVSGIVTQRNFDNGDLSGGQPILQVQQLNPLKVSFNIQENYFPQLKPQMQAAIRLDSYPDEEFEGRVRLVYPTIDPVSHTFTTEIVVNNNKMKIRPGMYARVSFNFGSVEHIVVPDVAVVRQEGVNDRYVYVLNTDNTVIYTKVTLGKRLGNLYEILSGLNEGDQVVVAGLTRLVDGAAVKVVQ